MTTALDAGAAKAPWHFWLVGAVALIWNAFGAYDYFMTETKGDAYMQASGMNASQIAAMHAMPAWMIAAWAVGVWGALAGALLLLGRSRYAVYAYVASLAGLVVDLVYTYGLSGAAKTLGTQGLVMNAVITAGAIFFLWYSWRMAKRGLLR